MFVYLLVLLAYRTRHDHRQAMHRLLPHGWRLRCDPQRVELQGPVLVSQGRCLVVIIVIVVVVVVAVGCNNNSNNNSNQQLTHDMTDSTTEL